MERVVRVALAPLGLVVWAVWALAIRTGRIIY